MREKRNLNSRKMTRTLLILSFVFIGIVNCANAQIVDQGTCGENLTWVLMSDSVLTISGNGAMDDFDYPDYAPWYSHREMVKTINIGNAVTTIGNLAFLSCRNLTAIEIPNSITAIGVSAFIYCRLTSVEIPNNVITIGSGAFYGNGLTSLIIGNSVISIGMEAFSYNSFTTVEIPNSVITIENNAFTFCSNLSLLTIGNSVTTIKGTAFAYCTSLITVEIPRSVTSIGSYVFSNCTSLTSINVNTENTHYSSNDGILYNKSQNTLIACPAGKAGTIQIPSSVTLINGDAFYSCSALTAINVDVSNSNYSSIDGILYNKSQNTLIACPAGKIGAIIIPNTVTTIGNSAFAYCSHLTSIEIPNSVTSIGNDAFRDCSGLTAIEIPNTITIINHSTFLGCSNLKSIVIPDLVTTIDNQAFTYCSSLVSVTIGNSVNSIGHIAFAGCTTLDTIICKASSPPTLTYEGTFSNAPISSISIYVPCSSLEAYQTAEYWNDFTNFIELPYIYSAISGITSINNSFIISWHGVVNSYELYRDNELLATVSTTTYTDNNVTDGEEYCYKVKAIQEGCESVISEEVCKIFRTVGITQQQIINFKIYPNPTNDKFVIEFDGVGYIKLYDMLGKEVLTQNANGKTEINISHLLKGIYSVNIISDGKVIRNSKIIKQ